MTDFARCYCAECLALDKLPVRRHGIPHAWQPNMLSAMPAIEPYPEKTDAQLDAELAALDRQIAQRSTHGLALFDHVDQPTLF